MPSWIEAVLAVNDDIIACEGRFTRQCTHVVALAAQGQVPSEDEMLLVSYGTSLGLVRLCRDNLLRDAGKLA